MSAALRCVASRGCTLLCSASLHSCSSRVHPHPITQVFFSSWFFSFSSASPTSVPRSSFASSCHAIVLDPPPPLAPPSPRLELDLCHARPVSRSASRHLAAATACHCRATPHHHPTLLTLARRLVQPAVQPSSRPSRQSRRHVVYALDGLASCSCFHVEHVCFRFRFSYTRARQEPKSPSAQDTHTRTAEVMGHRNLHPHPLASGLWTPPGSPLEPLGIDGVPAATWLLGALCRGWLYAPCSDVTVGSDLWASVWCTTGARPLATGPPSLRPLADQGGPGAEVIGSKAQG